MKIVITGITGLVGRALSQRLLKDGHQVFGLSRPHWNGETDVAPAGLLANCDAIVHLAGENIAKGRWTADRKRHLIASRVASAGHIREGLLLARHQPKIFISASGVGYFGDRGDEELNEDSSPGRDFLAELCQAWEAAADAVPAHRTVKARFGVVISSDGGFVEEVAPKFKRFGASRLGDGRQWFSWIHIHDLVEALVHALTRENLHGAVNMVAPHPVTNGNLTREMRLQLGTFPAPPVPAFALKLLFGELAAALLSSQRAIPHKLEQLGFQWKYPTMKEALQQALSEFS